VTSRFISLPVAEDHLADAGKPMSRFMQRAAVSIGHQLQRVVSHLPMLSKFLNFLAPPQLKLEPKGPEADALRAQIHQEMAVAATPRLKPRFNRPAGPTP
jgi:hypothetical protein